MLVARPARHADRTEAASSPANYLAVAGDRRLHVVIGGIHHGVRIDIWNSVEALPLDQLIFPLTVSVAPGQLVEFGRLVSLARGKPTTAITPQRLYRILLALRVIDALGEGASLRTIGETFVRAGDWPGRGESTKSAARRLRASALAIWNAGPRVVFPSASLPLDQATWIDFQRNGELPKE